MSAKLNFENLKLSRNPYGRMKEVINFKSLSEELADIRCTTVGNEKRKGTALITSILSLLIVVLELYYISRNNKISTGLIAWNVIAFFAAILPGDFMVRNSKYKFRKLIGGLLLQICLPVLVTIRYIPEITQSLTNWCTIYGLGIAVFVFCLVIACSNTFSAIIMYFSALSSFLAIGYVVKHYIGMSISNTIGVIIWALLSALFGPLLNSILFTQEEGFGKFLLIIAAVLPPAFGVINTVRFPLSFWSGWWIVYVIGFMSIGIVYSIMPSTSSIKKG